MSNKQSKRRARGRGRELSRLASRGREAGAALSLSREAVFICLKGFGRPVSQDELASQLLVESDAAREVLNARLDAMRDEAVIRRNRRGLFSVVNLAEAHVVIGVVSAHREGYGFLIPEAGGRDLYLAPREMRVVIHGDRVSARVKRIDRAGRPEGAVVEILERRHDRVVGRFFRRENVGEVVPDDRRINHSITIADRENGSAKEGDIVVAEILQAPSQNGPATGRVVEVLGHDGTPGLETEVAMRSYGIPNEWPSEVTKEAADIAWDLTPSDLTLRTDLRTLPFVTIDGDDAKDFDDAVFCHRDEAGWTLYVAIADVSHYVSSGSALDQEARRRGTSVYFPGRVVPMLPERLSNGVCSLNPGVDRLVLVCRMRISDSGRIVRSTFDEAVIRSAARLTYDEVAAGIIDGDQKVRMTLGALIPHLQELHALYRVLKYTRRKRGALDLDSVEARFVFAASAPGVARIETVVRNTAHEVIEECMIAANVCAARFVGRHRLPALYRVHEPPQAEKLAELAFSLSEIGLRLPAKGVVTPLDLARVVESADEQANRQIVQTLILRSLAQASYRPKNTGHFGLALPAYAHFTSPIRRYPDLALHRSIRAKIHQSAPTPVLPGDMGELGGHTSMTERRAEEAVRDVVASMKCQYMSERVGEQFSGLVSGVAPFGVFVSLSEMPVDGLVHVSGLGDDYFSFDPVRHRLSGKQTGQTYCLTDRLDVRVARVDIAERKIDFELVKTGSKRALPRLARRRTSRSRAGRRKGSRDGR